MKLRTFGFIVTLALGLLVVGLSAEAQQPKKIYRIGWLSNAVGGRRTLFKQAIHELG